MADLLRDSWPVISFVLYIVLALVAGLGLRWIAGLISGVKSDIKIAVLELKSEFGEKYATTGDLEKVESDLRRDINVAGRVEAVHADVKKLLIRRHEVTS